MQTSSGDPHGGYVLLIERGQTRFPQRPITSDRFLIGAGSNCQLQLGGEMPLLHSIIVPEGDHLWIDAVVPQPPLILNGQTVREAELRRGDVLEIGPFVFSIGTSESPREPVQMPAVTQRPQTVQDVIDAIGQELAQLQALVQAREGGAAALLQAARQAGTREQTTSGQEQAASPVPDTLMALLQELRDRALTLDQRETSLDEYARQLALTQAQLREQLEQVCEQIQQDPAPAGSQALRLTA